MKLGIQFYDLRKDAQAMDRFMDVLTKGDPAERSMANDYINLINHRMNTGESLPMAPRPDLPEARVAAAAVPAINFEAVADPESAFSRPRMEDSARPAAPGRVEPPSAAPRADKSVMGKEIKVKISNLMEASLKRLKAMEGVQVIAMDNGSPQAIAIPSSLLFQSGMAFKKSAAQLLDLLTALSYSLSGAQITVLPEGTSIGDAKILDMRRTMGISSHLFSAGIAPARVRVNLLNAQTDMPRMLQNFKGIIFMFAYNEPLVLTVESSLADESGPPISLGIFPESINPGKSEGSIIEFSVQDPPSGLVSWEFKMLQPATAADGGELMALQEVGGGSPAYHQIYWNGRKNYFGSIMPAGRYECVLTATDARNRKKTLHRWIWLRDSNAAARVPAVAQAQPQTRAPSAELPSETGQGTLGVQLVSKTKVAAKKRRKPAARSKKKKTASSKVAAKPAKLQVSPYELFFAQDSQEMTAEGEKVLSQIAETMTYYPMENLDLTGYAHSAEPEAASLAQKRAQIVAGLLINKYNAEPKKIRIHSTVSETPSYKVEIRFVGSE